MNMHQQHQHFPLLPLLRFSICNLNERGYYHVHVDCAARVSVSMRNALMACGLSGPLKK
jgi:hypothetical protein